MESCGGKQKGIAENREALRKVERHCGKQKAADESWKAVEETQKAIEENWLFYYIPNLSRNGGMAEWRDGGMAEWWNGMEWQKDEMTEWGKMAGWRDGGIYHAVFMYRTSPAEWRNGYIPNLPDIFMVHANDNTTTPTPLNLL